MKIAIVGLTNIKHMTLISLYTSVFDENNIDYDLIYADKYNEDENNSAKKIYKYNLKINHNDTRVKKMMRYLGFRKFAIEIMKKNDYDLVIIWGSPTGYLFHNYLSKNHSNSYIYNIRDYGLEKNRLIKKVQKKIVENSIFTTISSKKFLNFLPESSKYLFVNSINPRVAKELKKVSTTHTIEKPIRICFIGYVRFLENDKKLLCALKNDKRFIVQYFGSGASILEKFALENNILNTEFINSFDSNQTSQLLKRADVINNLYGNKSLALDTAVSIKYYYSLLLNLPIMVWKETYMAEITKSSPGTFIFDGDYESLSDNLYEWYININRHEMNCQNREAVQIFEQENKEFEQMLKRIIEIK